MKKYSSKIEKKIIKKIGIAIERYNLFEDGDRILVGISGGKDSFAMLKLMKILQKRAPVKYEIIPAMVIGDFKGFSLKPIFEYVGKEGFFLISYFMPIEKILREKGKRLRTICSFCSRLRRGALYQMAMSLGCNKIALGHHADDLIETFFLNMFYNATLRAMSPNYLAENEKVRVIRPLILLFEDEIKEYTKEKNIPSFSFGCPIEEVKKRERGKIKNFLKELEKKFPGAKENILNSLSNIKEETFLK